MSENDTAEGSTSRRTVLKSVGGAIATAGVSQVAATSVVASGSTVEIPKVVYGDEVIRTKEVPRAWWEQVKAARRLSHALPEQIEGATGASRVPHDDEIAGKNQIAVEVKFPDDDTRDSARVPDERDGVPIETGIEASGGELHCRNQYTEYKFHGGQHVGQIADYEDDNGDSIYQGCAKNREWAINGTMACYCSVDNDDKDYFLTAHHNYDLNKFGNRICDDITDGKAHCGFQDNGEDEPLYPAGVVSQYHDSTRDYALVRNHFTECIDGAPVNKASEDGLVDHGGSWDYAQVSGVQENLEDEMADGTTFFKTGAATGYETGTITEIDTNWSPDGCTNMSNHEDVVFDINSAVGNSGAMIYRTYPTGGHPPLAPLAALHLGASDEADSVTTTSCKMHGGNAVVVKDESRGTSGQAIKNHFSGTLYIGG
jgi:hypothetical protein